jgi:hypothetical protein
MYASVSSTFSTYFKTLPLDSSTAHCLVVLFSTSVEMLIFLHSFQVGAVYSQLCVSRWTVNWWCAGVRYAPLYRPIPASADTESLNEERNVWESSLVTKGQHSLLRSDKLTLVHDNQCFKELFRCFLHSFLFL